MVRGPQRCSPAAAQVLLDLLEDAQQPLRRQVALQLHHRVEEARLRGPHRGAS